MKKCQIVHLTGASCRATGEYVIVGENSSVSEALAAGQYFCHQHGQGLLKKTPGALLAHVDADADRRVTTYTVAPEALDGHDSQTVKVMGEYGNGTKLPLRMVSTPEAFVGWQRMRYAEAKYTFFGEDWGELVGLTFFKEKFVEIIPQANGEPSKETALVELSKAVNKQTEAAQAEAAKETLAQEKIPPLAATPKLSKASQEAWAAQETTPLTEGKTTKKAINRALPPPPGLTGRSKKKAAQPPASDASPHVEQIQSTVPVVPDALPTLEAQVITMSSAFEAKVQTLIALAAQGPEALADAVRKGIIQIHFKRPAAAPRAPRVGSSSASTGDPDALSLKQAELLIRRAETGTFGKGTSGVRSNLHRRGFIENTKRTAPLTDKGDAALVTAREIVKAA